MPVYATEDAVYECLRRTFPRGRYALLRSVPNGTGGNAVRRIDAILMSLWPSRGLTLEGIEIKTQRSDVTRELRNPQKQEAHFRFLDRFWLAVGDKTIASKAEMPPTWGLLTPAANGRMYTAKKAPLLEPEPIDRAFLAALLRCVQHVATPSDVEEKVRQARREAERQVQAEVQERAEALSAHRMVHVEAKLKNVEAFEKVTGLNFGYGDNLHVASMFRHLPHHNDGYIRELERRARRYRETAEACEAGAEALKKLSDTKDQT